MIGGVSMWGLRRSSGGFSPQDLAGLILDLDADKGITLNGGDVSAWADQSGEGNDISQGTEADQPLFVASWRNGRASLSFDGVAHHMRLAAFASGDVTQPCTRVAVLEWPVTLSGAMPVVSSGDTGKRQDLNLSADTAKATATGAVSIAAGATSAAASIVTGVFDGASASLTVRNAGEAEVSNTGDTGSTPGSGVALAAFGDGAGRTQCKIAKVLVYTRALSAQEILDLSAYLGAYYNIVVA